MAIATRVRITGGTYDTGRVESLYVTDCAGCGVVFAITSDYEQRRREDGKVFYCPNGHHCLWSESEADRERKARKSAERQLEWARTAQLAAEDQARTAEYQRRAAKGQLTKIRKRIANGVCPCCNRSFTPLAAHMATEHPDFVVPEATS